MVQPTEHSRLGLELRLIDRSRRRARRYHIVKARSLFGELGLLTTWGRIGRPARVRLETFTCTVARTERWDQLIARRIAHGYVTHPSG
jgi:predicted DNA-binding WGR domain protein